MNSGSIPLHEDGHSWWRSRRIAASLVAGVTLATSVLLSALGVPSPVPVLVALVGLPVGAFYFARETVEELVTDRRAGTGLLMLAAAIGAVLLGEVTDAAILVFLFSITEALEENAIDRTRHAIQGLMKLVPATATLLEAGAQRTVPASSLRPGDRFLVKPGDAVPTDGVVREGTSSVNEAIVTGESLPRPKGHGDLVLAGSANLDGALVVEATKPFEENTVATIVRLVERAQEARGRAATIVDRFSQVYTPFVFLLATATGLAVGTATGAFGLGAVRGVTLLVAASPCALAISVPVTFIAAIGRSARDGILVKGGVHLETLAKVRTVAFDKTGTLTTGTLRVAEVWARKGGGEDEVLSVAAALETWSEHPAARAIVLKAEGSGVPRRAATEFRNVPGKGVEGQVEGEASAVGSLEMCAASRPEGIEEAEGVVRGLQPRGMTTVAVVRGGAVLGVIGLADAPREEASAAVRRLESLGVASAMLTGDNPATARSVAAQVGIREVYAGLLPEEKVEQVQVLRRRGLVAMVGDGVNDAPALAEGDVGIAMGVAGSDVALETADVALMSDNLEKVPRAIELARATRRVSMENVAASVAILAVLIPLAALGVIGISLAVVAHEGSEILVVASAIRMLRS